MRCVIMLILILVFGVFLGYCLATLFSCGKFVGKNALGVNNDNK